MYQIQHSCLLSLQDVHSPPGMNTILVQNIKEMIARAEHILLLTDERIDGDTLGSTMGLFHVLTNAEKRVSVFSPKPLPATFAYLPTISVIKRDDFVLAQPTIDLAIICDCSDGAYLPPVLAKMAHKVPLISFDHHLTNPNYGTINAIEPTAASTADVVWRFVKEAGYTITPDAAQCFLTGIITDTQVFFSSNTTNAAVEAAAELLKHGAKLQEIIRFNYINKSTNFLKIWGIALERLFHDDSFGGIATVVTQKDIKDIGASPEEIESIAGVISEFLNAVLDESHDIIVVYRETDDGHIKGSARARTKNVAEIAEHLYGGGGHRLAAGFKVLNARMEKFPEGQWKIIRTPATQNLIDPTKKPTI